MPDKPDRAETVPSKTLTQPMGDVTWPCLPKPWQRRVNRRADYDRFLDALTPAKAQAGIKNTATAFGLLLDLVARHVPDWADDAVALPSP